MLKGQRDHVIYQLATRHAIIELDWQILQNMGHIGDIVVKMSFNLNLKGEFSSQTCGLIW